MEVKLDLPRSKCLEFLTKAYELVDDPSTDQVISWSPNGKAIVVWIPEECERDLLPKYLQTKTFGTFHRYGFCRLAFTKERYVYACNDFVRGKPELLGKICERYLAQVRAVHDKHYKAFFDRLKTCKTKKEEKLVRREQWEKFEKDQRDQREACMKAFAASREAAAAQEAEAAALEAAILDLEEKAAAAALED